MQRIWTELFVRVASTRTSLLCSRLYHIKEKTLYDVLNLKQDCSELEIRNAFLKLSKMNHPDMKGSTAGGTRAENDKFIHILHAYRILCKKDTRARYDTDLLMSERFASYGYSDNAANNVRQPNQYTRHGNMHPSADPNPGPYYGVKGITKVSNVNIARFLIGLAVLGAIIQFILIRHSFTLHRDALDDYSKECGRQHANVRADAEKYGNKEQMERIAKKIIQRNI